MSDAERLTLAGLCEVKEGEELVATFGYWVGYRLLLEIIDNADWPKEKQVRVRCDLDAVHAVATDILMREAFKAGLNPHALYECGCLVRELYRAAPERIYAPAVFDTWPHCMTSWRYELPEGQQSVLRNGEEVFFKLQYLLAPPAAGKQDSLATAKRSTETGEARLKLIAALTMHHQYANGGCLHREPIGVAQLARLAKVAKSTAARFLKQHFDGFTQYRRVCRTNPARLAAILRALNGEEFSEITYGRVPPGEGEPED